MDRDTSNQPTLTLPPGVMRPRSVTAEMAREVQRALSDEHELVRQMRERGDLSFQTLIALASTHFKVPQAVVMLSDQQHLWVEATAQPMPCQSEEDEDSLCHVTLRHNQLTVIEDTHADPLFSQHSITQGPDGVRFYAGAPLTLRGGTPVGVFCLLDTQPRHFGAQDREQLQHLAELAARELRQAGELLVMRRQLQDEAFFDPLTSLPRQALAHSRLQEALHAAFAEESGLVVMRLDLNQFTSVNEVLGRDTGDQILREVARRLRSNSPMGSMVARWQGDEFIIVTSAVQSGEAAAPLARRLLGAISDEPFVCQSTTHHLTAALGASVFPGDAKDADTLMDRASMALREARTSSDNHFLFYDQLRNRDLHDELFLWNELHSALKKQEFWMAYQPKVDLVTGQICGAEALIRWNHPQHGFISPGRFIPVAEQTGLISELGRWTLRRVCQQLHQWRSQGAQVVPVAVNIASAQLQEPGFVQHILDLLQEFKLERSLLALELTERTLVEDTQTASQVIDELSRHGVTCSIDDFGTGYSSLSYLAGLPLHALKVDRSFVSKIGSDERAGSIVEAIIGMSHSLGLRVIAEGVETQEELDFLRRCGCDSFQGYFFSKPVPSDDFIAQIHDQHRLEISA